MTPEPPYIKKTCFYLLFLLTLLLLCYRPSAFGQGASYTGTPIALTRGGFPAAGATVTVCSGNVTVTLTASPPCSPYASIYSDSALSVPIAQPGFVTDGLGNYPFFVTAGATYTIVLTGSGFTGSSTVWTAPINGSTAVSVKSLNAIRFADQFPGGSVTAKINAAVADCPAYTNSTDNGCVVVISSSMACGEGSQAPDNVILWDFRNCAQSQGLRFNLSTAAAGNVRSKMFLQDNFNAGKNVITGSNSSATLYVLSKPDYPNSTSATVAAFNATNSIDALDGNFTGNLIGIEGSAFAGSTNGGAYTVSDIRGATFNSSCGGNTNCGQIVSLFGQAPVNSGSGTVATAYSLFLENPSLTTSGEKLSLYAAGYSRFANGVSIAGSVGAFGAGVGFGVFNPTNISGITQFGIQSAFQSTSAATTSSAGGVFRSDVAASTTQGTNYGLIVQTPLIGALGVITEWNGLNIQAGPTAGTKYAIKTLGADQSLFGGKVIAPSYTTTTNCSAVGTAANPSVAACSAASAGSFSCATAATGGTCTVNTTAVTANSQIFVQEDETLGTKLGVTCNTSTTVIPTSRLLSARVASTSFTINLGTVTTNPACFSYFIVN